jgi:hypothetical protein
MGIRSVRLLLVSAVLGSVLAPGAASSQAVYDGFETSFPEYAAGGTGFVGPWLPGGFNIAGAAYAPLPRSLKFRGLERRGGSVAGGTFAAINGMLRGLALPIGLDGTTVYLSFLLRPLAPLGEGQFGGFFGLTLNGLLGNDLFVGRAGVEPYVLETRGGTGQVVSDVPAQVNRTALLVLKAEFLNGNDTFTLYVNPNPRAAEPASGFVKSDLDLGTVGMIGVYSTGAFAIDEIRMGATFEESLGQP